MGRDSWSCYRCCSKLLVAVSVSALIFLMNVRLCLSIGQDYDNSNGGSNNNNETETEQLTVIDWDYETIVAVRWHIDNPPVVDYDRLRFDIHFSVSDYIEADKHVRYDIYQNVECGNAGDIITDADGFMETWVTEDDTPIGPGIDENIKRTITVSNQLIAQTIAQSKSYATETTTTTITETGNDASIAYCVRFSLWNGEGPLDPCASEINHLAVTIGLSLDLNDNFSIKGQKVEAQNKGLETSDDQFFVEAFVCDETGKRPDLMYSFVQGDTVRICIQPTTQAAEVGFRMQRIEKFTFVQGLASQGAILNAEVSPNLLTELTCQPGAKQCMFETLLFAYFFQNGGQGTVLGTGEATLQWGGEGTDRRLQFYLGESSQLAIGTDDVEEEEEEKEEEERMLQERSSTKSIQVPTFSIVAEDKNQKRPSLLVKSKAGAKAQRSILVTLILILCIVMLLPLVYYARYSYRKRQHLRALTPINLENELTPSLDDSDSDRMMLSVIPEDLPDFDCREEDFQHVKDSADIVQRVPVPDLPDFDFREAFQHVKNTAKNTADTLLQKVTTVPDLPDFREELET